MRFIYSIFCFFAFFFLTSCKKDKVNETGPQNELKPQAAGLTNRNYSNLFLTPPASPDVMKIANCVVVRVAWRDLQPNADGDIVRPNLIDDAINYAQQQNNANPGLNMNIKIRVMCGVASPDWVKTQSGSFTLLTDLAAVATSPSDSLMPRFWQPEFLNAYASFQAKLAALYDNVPEVREIVNGGTGALYGEAFIRYAGNGGPTGTNSTSYINAGWTAEKDLAAIRSTIDAMKVWKKTRISMAFNEFINIAMPPGVTRDAAPTKSVIDYMVATLGKQAVLGNNSLRDDNAQGADDWLPGGLMYDISGYMKTVHNTQRVPIYYQTATIDKLSDLRSTIEKGISLGAGAIETPVPPNQLTNYISLSELQSYDSRLEAQAGK